MMNSSENNDRQPPKLLAKKLLTGSDKKLVTIQRKWARLFVLIPLVLLAILWIWKQTEINSVEKLAEQDRKAMQQTAISAIVKTNEAHLRLLAKPFVWAIRTEMLQGNYSQVHLYLNEMVKEKNVKLIAVANDSGKIISSTNKKFEGLPFSTVGDATNLTINSTMVNNTSDSLIVMSSPIMGFDKRLGTLLITYMVPAPGF